MAADPFVANVSSLLHFEGDPSRRAVFDSVKNRYFYSSGGFSLSTSQKKFGLSSGQFSTASNSMLTLGDASPDFAFGVGDFTLEAWAYPTAHSTASRLIHFGQSWNTSDSVSLITSHVAISDRPAFWVAKFNVNAPIVTGPSVLPLNAWVHVAVTRKAGVFRLFVGGVLVDTNSSYVGVSVDASASNTSTIGNVPNLSTGTEGFTGYIDEVRITKGVCRYDATFTPPTEPFEPLAESSELHVRSAGVMYRAYGDRLPQLPLNAAYAGVYARWETQTTGSGTISGVVTIENIPGSRKVRLYRKQDGMLIRETWSAANGAYSFTNIDPAWEYFVVAHDHLRVYNGVIQDMLVP